MNIGWYHPSLVRMFRLRLWAELLGMPPQLIDWKPSTFVDRWNNTKVAPEKQAGLIVPHDPDKSKVLEGEPSCFLIHRSPRPEDTVRIG
jgi:hypothetical protein